MKKLTLLLASLFIGALSYAQCASSFTSVVSPANDGTVAFTSTSMGNGPFSYFWNFSDGTSSFSVNPNHTFNTGTWYVCLTIADSVGGCTSTFCDSVTVINNSVANCNAFFMPFDSVGYGYFWDQSTGTNLTYSWDFGDGSTGTTVGSATHLYTMNGTYYVCLTVANAFLGCSNTYCDSITIGNNTGGSSCTGAFTSMNDTIGNGVTFSSSVTGTADQYSWSFGDGNTSTSANPYYVYATAGTYYVCLTVTSSTDTTCSSTTCHNITVGAPAGGCSAYFVIIQDSTNLYNYWVYNYSNNNNNTTYLWSFGDGTSSTAAFPSHTYNGTGPYYLCLTITDSTFMGLCTAYYCDSIYPGHGVSQVTTLNVINPATVGIAEHTEQVETLTNYPNPFSGSTTISYSIGQKTTIELSLLDLLGNKIKVIESGNKPAGSYKTNFDASNISAGIYLLQLKTDTKSTTRKLIIAK